MWQEVRAKLHKGVQSPWVAWLLLLSGVCLTLFMWLSARQHAEAARAAQFKQAVSFADSQIQQHLDRHRQALRSVAQLYAASQTVTADEFAWFVSANHRDTHQPGFLTIGFIADHSPLTPLAQSAHLSAKPLPPDTTQTPLLSARYQYVFPHSQSNLALLKQPLVNDPMIRRALLHAKQHLTLTLANDPAPAAQVQVRRQLQLLLPITRVSTATQQRLHRHFLGWAFVKLDAMPFLGHALLALTQADLEVAVSQLINGQWQTLYQSMPPVDAHDAGKPARFESARTLSVDGVQWRLQIRSTPRYEAGIDYRDANRSGLFGLILSVMMASLVYFAVMRTRTQQVLAQFNQALMTSEQRWRFALEGTGDGIWDWNVTQDRVTYSDRWKQMLGYAPEDIDQQPSSWQQRIHVEDAPQVMEALQAVLKGQHRSFALEYRILCKDGSWKWVFDRGMVLMSDRHGLPSRILGTLADISKIKQSEAAVWQFANVDTLTGLLNRRMFYVKLDHAIEKASASGQKIAVIFLDLDRFKEVNDTLGHAQGDRLLQQAAKRLQACVREGDVVARLGGDEFALMLDEAQDEVVEKLAKRVLEQLAQPFRLDNAHAYVSASLGVALFPEDANNKEDLMMRVDQAMYAAKHKGGSCFIYFTPRMQQHAEHRMQLSNDLRLAIAKKQFFLEYQPVVHLQTNQVMKAEALIRWRHPERGVIPPAEFIGIAEDNLLILQIGQWVFQQAVEQCRHWRDRLHPAFQVAINKSPVQFAHERKKQQDWLYKMVRQQLPGGMITVEITERLLLDGSQHVKERLAFYREAGVQISLDDFGTGYSALSYLKKFPIDYVKIDRSFVRELGTSHEDAALCQAIIVMAHSLGMQVVAEGIENADQLAILKGMGCDYGQGFYFSQPLRPTAFEAWLQGWCQSVAQA